MISFGFFSRPDFLAFFERHNRLLPIRPVRTPRGSHPAEFPVDTHGVDGKNLHLKQLLDGRFDVDFRGSGSNAENILIRQGLQIRRALGDQRLLNNV